MSHSLEENTFLIRFKMTCAKSLGEALYFVSFINDHLRKVWVSVLKTKDRVLEVFKEVHAKVECETIQKLKSVQANNGGEYCALFKSYCK